MKKIIVMILSLLTTALYAQDGIQFDHGTWKETLAKAKKENKLIFIDIYTSWCGPCKLMAQEVFPLKTVGDKFNSNFINYKTDAEKGEGIDIAKTYKVNAYPTYLFVNGDGVLYYTALGSMPEAQFLKEANNALVEFADPKPLTVWDAEYAAKKGDRDFLLKYLQKRQKLALKSDFVVDQFVSVSAKDSLLSNETLTLLLSQQNASIDGAFFKFLGENKTEIEKILAAPVGSLDATISRYAASDLSRAIQKKDIQLMERIIAIRAAIPSQVSAEWEADGMRMSYYTQTANEKELIKVLNRYSLSLTSYDKQKIKEADAKELANFEKAVAEGQFKGAPEAVLDQARKFYARTESTNYAYRLRGLSEAALKIVNDKTVLNQALKWLELASAYSDNFTMAETTAGILQKLGRKEEALTYQRKAIASFAGIKMDNEIIKTRLEGNLSKILEGKPTWIEADSSALVAKKK